MDSMEIFARLPGALDRRELANSQELDREGLIGRTRSTSYLPKTGERAEALYREVGELFDAHARAGHVRLALTTFVVRVQLG
jgi:hypothetical protein